MGHYTKFFADQHRKAGLPPPVEPTPRDIAPSPSGGPNGHHIVPVTKASKNAPGQRELAEMGRRKGNV